MSSAASGAAAEEVCAETVVARKSKTATEARFFMVAHNKSQRCFSATVIAHHEPLPFRLPMPVGAVEWERLFDTARPEAEGVKQEGGAGYALEGRTLALFRQVDVLEEAAPQEGR